MTVIWEKSTTESSYKITRAGNSIRLYRNQVLHSQWNPISPITGKIWDLFLLSAIGGQQDVKRALVLGAGGGAVINLIHKFYPEANIDAIDLDDMQLYIAKRFFKVRSGKINLIHDNAFDWVTNDIVQRYDLIIDDVFFEKNCVPFRSVSAKKNWVMKLLERLEYDGTLVINFADQKEWKASLHEIKETLINFNKFLLVLKEQLSYD